MPKEKVESPAPTGITGVVLTDKHAVIRVDEGATLAMERRIVLCGGGFGCQPHTLGSAVFGTKVVTGDNFRYDRQDFVRLATPEEIEAAQRFYKKYSYAAVSKKVRRGKKLLVEYKQYNAAAQLLKTTKTGEYVLVILKLNNQDQWSVEHELFERKNPDELLRALNKVLPK